MLQNYKKHRESGFTIIEVLIVLAIAGLIMLVVFMAVPALNRNSHNNGYRTDARNLLAAYSEIANNKGGAPLGATDNAAVLSAANTGDIKTLKIQPASGNGAQTVAATDLSTAKAVIVPGSVCNSTNDGATAAGASARSIALVFVLETSGGNTTNSCIGS